MSIFVPVQTFQNNRDVRVDLFIKRKRNTKIPDDEVEEYRVIKRIKNSSPRFCQNVKMLEKGDWEIGNKLFKEGIGVQPISINSKKNVLIMIYYPSQELFTLIEKSINGNLPRFTFLNCMNIMYQLYKQLKKIHKQQIIYRDIKGENLLINTEGILKIIDFGLFEHFNYLHLYSGTR